jgi:uridine nucleosidase
MPDDDPPIAPTPIWLDVDTGHDDAFALLLAAHHPSLHLLGVSTVFGNAPLPHTTHNTLSILTALSAAATVPVYPGAPRAFLRGPASAPDIHGATGLDGTIHLPSPTSSPCTDKPAITAIYDALIAQPRGKAWLVATGSLTNIALLFSVYPDLGGHLGGVSIMGGAIGGGFTDADLGRLEGEGGMRTGNWTPWAEYNIYVDPESAKAVLERGGQELTAKITLVTLDLTHSFLADGGVLQGLLYGGGGGGDAASKGDGSKDDSPSSTRTLFHEILTFFAGTYAQVFGLTEGPPLHDPLAVAAAFAPELFDDGDADDDGARYEVTVVTEGEHGDSAVIRSGESQCGRTVARKLPRGEKGIRIPRAVRKAEMWRVLEECLGRAERAAADAADAAAVEGS